MQDFYLLVLRLVEIICLFTAELYLNLLEIHLLQDLFNIPLSNL